MYNVYVNHGNYGNRLSTVSTFSSVYYDTCAVCRRRPCVILFLHSFHPCNYSSYLVICYARNVNVTDFSLTAIFTREEFCLSAHRKNGQVGERPLSPYCQGMGSIDTLVCANPLYTTPSFMVNRALQSVSMCICAPRRYR